jgi:hypothetical protein
VAFDEHTVSLVIELDEALSSELLAEVDIEPDESWHQGETLRSGRTRPRSALVYTSGLPREHSADKQITALLARLEPAAERIRRLGGRPGASVSLDVVYGINGPQSYEGGTGVVVRGLGVSLTAAQIGLLETMGAGVWVDIYVDTDAD